jgi:hypothetical protein
MAKKSRRLRRQESSERQRRLTPESQSSPLAESPAPAIAVPVEVNATSPAEPALRRKTVNLAQDYFYVYQELRTVLIVAVLMLIVLVGLSFVI